MQRSTRCGLGSKIAAGLAARDQLVEEGFDVRVMAHGDTTLA